MSLAADAGQDTGTPLAAVMQTLGRNARAAARTLARAGVEQKNRALRASADAVRSRAGDILESNARDVAAGRDRGLRDSLLDRLAA